MMGNYSFSIIDHFHWVGPPLFNIRLVLLPPSQPSPRGEGALNKALPPCLTWLKLREGEGENGVVLKQSVSICILA